MAIGAMLWGAFAAITAATNSFGQASGTRLLVGVFGKPYLTQEPISTLLG